MGRWPGSSRRALDEARAVVLALRTEEGALKPENAGALAADAGKARKQVLCGRPGRSWPSTTVEQALENHQNPVSAADCCLKCLRQR